MPPARSVKAIDPAVLRVTIDFEKVDFVRIQHDQTELRRRCFRVGMNTRKRDTAVTRLTGYGPGKADAHRLRELVPAVAPRVLQSGVVCVMPHQNHRAADFETALRDREVPADLRPGPASSSVTFVLRASLTKVNRGELCRNPRKTTVRFAGRPSARTVAIWTNRE